MIFLLAFATCVCAHLASGEVNKGYYTFIKQNESISEPAYICPYTAPTAPVGVGGVDFLLSVREDYGWRDQTHRAIIVLALNEEEVKSKTTEDERKLMLHQLDVELSMALLWNSTKEEMPINDLALYVSAFVAVNRSPRDFHGKDLVAVLEKHAATTADLHPYIVLTLCNARAVTVKHLKQITKYINEENHHDRQFMELKALALKAFFCAREDIDISEVKVNLDKAVRSQIDLQKPGGNFGNLYTSSLSMQALTTSGNEEWKEKAAIVHMISLKTVDVSVVSTYYIEMALHSRRIPFLKRLSKKQDKQLNELEILLGLPRVHQIHYGVRRDDAPDYYLTAVIMIPRGITFYQCMLLAAHANDAFRFLDYRNKEGYPEIYSIAGTPNDSERSLYWQLHIHNNNTRSYEEIKIPPSQIMAVTNTYFMWRYKMAFQHRDNA